jgi:hypothetical protein
MNGWGKWFEGGIRPWPFKFESANFWMNCKSTFWESSLVVDASTT